jgi:hypothetical protein
MPSFALCADRLGPSGAREESTVNWECVSGDPGRIAGSEEGDCSSDVLRFPDASKRIEVPHAIGAALLSIPVSGPDGRSRDRVHSNAIGSQTGRKVDREGADSCFRGGVGFAAQSREGIDRADIDDCGRLFATSQMRDRGPTAPDDTEKVELDHPDPDLICGLFKCAVVGVAASHVDHDIDSTQFGDGISECSLDRGRIGHIQQDSQMAKIAARQIRSHLLGFSLIKVGHGNAAAFLGQSGGAGAANPVRAAGDYHRSVGKAFKFSLVHERSLPLSARAAFQTHLR